MLGRDRFGDFLLDSLKRAGVGTEDVVRTSAANTALALVTLDASGDRSFSFYRGPSADLLFRAADFRMDTFRDVAVFHVCSNSMTDRALAETTREGMQRAHKVGALVSFDLNLRPALWPAGVDPRPLVWPALHLADVVKLGAEEFAWLAVDGEQAVLDRLWLGRTRLVIITDAERPIRWFHPDVEGELPGYAVTAVDSTAAGDALERLTRLLFCRRSQGRRRDSRPQPATRTFWVQAESLAAAAWLYARPDEPMYDDWYGKLWADAWDHFSDHR
jgi:fructokinase